MDTPVEDGAPAAGDAVPSIEDLIAGTTALQEAIRGLTESVGLLLKRDPVTRRLAVAAVAAVMAALAVVGITWKVWTATYVTQQEQTRTRTQVLCPLYGAFLSLGGSPARQAALTDLQRKALEAIASGYDVLQCATVTPTAPPH